MFDHIAARIREQTKKIEDHPQRGMLCRQALSRFWDELCSIADTVTESTATALIVREVGADNPFAALDPALLTDEQRKMGEKAVNEKLNRGDISLPKLLTDILGFRLRTVTDAFLEMLERLSAHRNELGALLPGGKVFSRIEDITFSAGDKHNGGRSVTVLSTDAGKLVYKPRDMRGEAKIYELGQKHFSDVLGIPKCIAFGADFGVSEFIEKKRPNGEKEARLFWHRMGGAAAVIKLLGCTDMHIENLTCADGKPYIIDLETVISPELSNEVYEKLHPELNRLKSTSPYLSSLLPVQNNGRELSVLMSTADDGCAPVVGQKRVMVCGYKTEFLSGYTQLYHRILKQKEELACFVSALSPEIPVRILIRNTQFYHDTLQKFYCHGAFADEEAFRKARARLEKQLGLHIRPEFERIVQSELRQIGQGDIPYFYTYADSNDLYSDGEVVASGVFNNSAKKHIRNNLDAFGKGDLSFDLQLLERSVGQYPRRLAEDEKEPAAHPIRTDDVLTKEQALAEAKKQFETVFRLSIEAPGGKLFWGYMSDPDCSFRFCEAGLANGLTGIAVFAAAYRCVCACGDDRAKESAESRVCDLGGTNELSEGFVCSDDVWMKELADRAVREAVMELERLYAYYEENADMTDRTPNLGESEGIGGILNGLALLKRYVGGDELTKLQEKALRILSRFRFSGYNTPDRMNGTAGLLSVLCRFNEYRSYTDLILAAAESQLSMKNLPYRDRILWNPFPDKKRPISGAGHGLAGIAEALFAAGQVLREEKYIRAAEDAIRFELEVYSEKIHTWHDLRTYPPVGYMHGYCSGAPGIGIMLERIRKMGYESEELEKCTIFARKSIDRLPLNARDHLCCGNSAVAEYYMTAGRFDETGRVLSAMRERSLKAGKYRYMGYDFHNGVTASLFYGASGIGYEMLRYACPEKIISVI